MRTPPNERLTSDIAGTPKARKASEPERRCILSGETGPRESLVRLAVSPAGLVLPDAQEKAPGRGAWPRWAMRKARGWQTPRLCLSQRGNEPNDAGACKCAKRATAHQLSAVLLAWLEIQQCCLAIADKFKCRALSCRTVTPK